VLVLDEPTNDLDIETLELLESLLVEYQGTVLLVSHDRAFLNQVVTSTLVFEGDGQIKEYAGGYDDWVRARSVAAPEPAATNPKPEPARPQRARPRRLSYHEERELESLPRLIETLEAEQAELHVRLADPAFYRQPGPEIASVTSRVESLQQELHAAYERWTALDSVS
jgi:ATP-binding cassette subfamily F protein uup